MNPRVSHDGPRGDEAWSALSLQDPRYSYSLERGLAILKVGRLSSHLLVTSDNVSARLGYRRDDEGAK